ncbi:hypothetical protein, partial [Pararcticibacter amylolyticus]|uniref:hypothetical protein n=1 Tax=Pararcticibacter amylolyticus TaxID=2173175 RepID=UPI001EE3AB9F
MGQGHSNNRQRRNGAHTLPAGLYNHVHPSYQAWSYAALLQDFNETVATDNIQLKPCAYLHNC